MCCTPTVRLLIVLTFATLLSLSSQLATGLSALAPAQRAGAQRLRALAQSGGPVCSRAAGRAQGGVAAEVKGQAIMHIFQDHHRHSHSRTFVGTKEVQRVPASFQMVSGYPVPACNAFTFVFLTTRSSAAPLPLIAALRSGRLARVLSAARSAS